MVQPIYILGVQSGQRTHKNPNLNKINHKNKSFNSFITNNDIVLEKLSKRKET